MIGLITMSSSRTALSGSSSVSVQLRDYNTPSHGSSGIALTCGALATRDGSSEQHVLSKWPWLGATTPILIRMHCMRAP